MIEAHQLPHVGDLIVGDAQAGEGAPEQQRSGGCRQRRVGLPLRFQPDPSLLH